MLKKQQELKAKQMVERKDNRKTDDILKSGEKSLEQKQTKEAKENKQKLERKFSTKSAGLGKKKLTAEQKKVMLEKRKKAQDMRKTLNRRTDEALKKKLGIKDDNKNDKK